MTATLRPGRATGGGSDRFSSERADRRLDRSRLDGRGAFITGKGTGIVLAAALTFADAGAHVIAGPDGLGRARANLEGARSPPHR